MGLANVVSRWAEEVDRRSNHSSPNVIYLRDRQAHMVDGIMNGKSSSQRTGGIKVIALFNNARQK